MIDRIQWTRAVVKVDGGRGFVVETKEQFVRTRYVITAAHCLRKLPPAHGMSYLEERTFKLLGPLDGKPSVWAECLFVDPIADIMVLGCPDTQDWSEQAHTFKVLIDTAVPLPIAGVPMASMQLSVGGATMRGPLSGECRGWMLSLAGQWFPCKVTAQPGALRFEDAAEAAEGGMSGSPIVNDDGV
jgi:hypothetical protein